MKANDIDADARESPPRDWSVVVIRIPRLPVHGTTLWISDQCGNRFLIALVRGGACVGGSVCWGERADPPV